MLSPRRALLILTTPLVALLGACVNRTSPIPPPTAGPNQATVINSGGPFTPETGQWSNPYNRGKYKATTVITDKDINGDGNLDLVLKGGTAGDSGISVSSADAPKDMKDLTPEAPAPDAETGRSHYYRVDFEIDLKKGSALVLQLRPENVDVGGNPDQNSIVLLQLTTDDFGTHATAGIYASADGKNRGNLNPPLDIASSGRFTLEAMRNSKGIDITLTRPDGFKDKLNIPLKDSRSAWFQATLHGPDGGSITLTNYKFEILGNGAQPIAAPLTNTAVPGLANGFDGLGPLGNKPLTNIGLA